MKKSVDLIQVISKLVKTDQLPEGVTMKLDGTVYVGEGNEQESNR